MADLDYILPNVPPARTPMAVKNRKSKPEADQARRPDGRLMTMDWQVNIILCLDNLLYTGITTDMERRFLQHKEGRGARYFRERQPLRVV